MLLAIFAYTCTFSQQRPVNDTLIPEQHDDDTVRYEPKLEGGALIDTVNIKNRPAHEPEFLNDTIKKKRVGKPKGKKD